MAYLNNRTERWLEKTRCISRLDIDEVPMEQTMVFYDDGEHFLTVRREKSVNIFAFKTLKGSTVIEAMEYIDGGGVHITTYDKKECDSSLMVFFTQSIRGKGKYKHLNKNDFFYKVYSLMHRLREHPEYLTEDEHHLLYVSIPNDLKELKRVYKSLDNDEKDAAKSYMKDTKEFLLKQLEEIKHSVQERKMSKIELKSRVIKVREKDRY